MNATSDFLTRANIPLLRRIQRQIDKAPERFQMRQFVMRTACGTAFCIGGWACALSGNPLHTSREESEILFFREKWPLQFQGPDDFSEEAAARAIARIEHFIQTEGRE